MSPATRLRRRAAIRLQDGRSPNPLLGARNSGAQPDTPLVHKHFDQTAYGSFRHALAEEGAALSRNAGHIADVGSSQRAFQRRYESYLSGTSMKSAETKIVLSQPESTRKLNQSAWRRFVTWLYDHQLGTTALLMVLGALAALLDFGLGRAIAGLLSSRVTLMDKSTSWLAQYSIFVLYGTFIFSIGYITVRYISTMAAGSGIPEISTILSGVDIPGFLNFRTLLSKVLGLLFVLGSGMQGGREGPFVHISAAIGTLLMKLPFFHKIRKSKSSRLQVLAAAAAVGVASAFGAPIGGVLFSIEVTAIYYLVANYWKSSVAALCGSLVVYLTQKEEYISLFAQPYDPLGWIRLEFAAFILLGLLGGLLGHAFVRLSNYFIVFRRKHDDWWVFRRPHRLSLAISLATGLILFPPGEYSRLSMISLFEDILRPVPLVNSNVTNAGDWGTDSGGIYGDLAVIFCTRWVLAAVSITLPVPIGLVLPLLVTGSALGRFVGEISREIFGPSIVAGGYAAVGAAALLAGTTRTVSAAVVVFEMTTSLAYLLPVLLAVIISVGVGNVLGEGIYEMITRTKHLPYLPRLLTDSMATKTAGDLMIDAPHVVSCNTTYGALARILREDPGDVPLAALPLVNDDNLLLGAVDRTALERLVHDECVLQEVGMIDVLEANPLLDTCQESVLGTGIYFTSQITLATMGISIGAAQDANVQSARLINSNYVTVTKATLFTNKAFAGWNRPLLNTSCAPSLTDGDDELATEAAKAIAGESHPQRIAAKQGAGAGVDKQGPPSIIIADAAMWEPPNKDERPRASAMRTSRSKEDVPGSEGRVLRNVSINLPDSPVPSTRPRHVGFGVRDEERTHVDANAADAGIPKDATVVIMSPHRSFSVSLVDTPDHVASHESKVGEKEKEGEKAEETTAQSTATSRCEAGKMKVEGSSSGRFDVEPVEDGEVIFGVEGVTEAKPKLFSVEDVLEEDKSSVSVPSDNRFAVEEEAASGPSRFGVEEVAEATVLAPKRFSVEDVVEEAVPTSKRFSVDDVVEEEASVLVSTRFAVEEIEEEARVAPSTRFSVADVPESFPVSSSRRFTVEEVVEDSPVAAPKRFAVEDVPEASSVSSPKRFSVEEVAEDPSVAAPKRFAVEHVPEASSLSSPKRFSVEEVVEEKESTLSVSAVANLDEAAAAAATTTTTTAVMSPHRAFHVTDVVTPEATLEKETVVGSKFTVSDVTPHDVTTSAATRTLIPNGDSDAIQQQSQCVDVPASIAEEDIIVNEDDGLPQPEHLPHDEASASSAMGRRPRPRPLALARIAEDARASVRKIRARDAEAVMTTSRLRGTALKPRASIDETFANIFSPEPSASMPSSVLSTPIREDPSEGRFSVGGGGGGNSSNALPQTSTGHSTTSQAPKALFSKYTELKQTRRNCEFAGEKCQCLERLTDEELDYLDTRPVDVYATADGIDQNPFHVVKMTPAYEVHFLFTMLKLPYVFVIKLGRLVGIITKDHLIAQLMGHASLKLFGEDEDDDDEEEDDEDMMMRGELGTTEEGEEDTESELKPRRLVFEAQDRGKNNGHVVEALVGDETEATEAVSEGKDCEDTSSVWSSDSGHDDDMLLSTIC